MFFTYFIVFVAWFIGGLIGGATAIGALMIAMPILTIRLTPLDAILVSCIVGFFSCIQLAYIYRRDCVWREIRDLIIGSIPGCALGVIALTIVSVQALEMMIALMITCFIMLQLFGKSITYTLPDSMIPGLAAGVVCGFVDGSVSMTGAPLGIYALLRRWEPNRARGNMSAFFLCVGCAAICMQAMAGLYTFTLLKYALVGTAASAIGQIIGVRIGRKFSYELFRRLILIFLFIAALILFVRAFN